MFTEVELAADRLYRAYCDRVGPRAVRAQQLTENFVDLPDGVRRKYFTGAAESCLTMGIDPEEYLKIAFTKLTGSVKTPLAKDVMGAQHVVKAWEHQRTAGIRVEREWTYMCHEIKRVATWTIPNQYPDEIALLLDPYQPFRAYFRVLYFADMYKVLFDRFGEAAYKELAADRKLRAYLRTIRGPQLEHFEELTRPFTDKMLEGEYNG